MAVHPVARNFFGTLVLLGRVRGPFPFDDRLERPGFDGEINFELGGAHGGTWNCRIDSVGLLFRRGSASSPIATLSMSAETFASLLKGELSFATAQMTGRVRVRGDGHASFLLGAMVTQFRRAGAEPGWQGKLASTWKRLVLSVP